MYYYKVPADSNFVITANATVNSINKHNQVAFGLMARDAMYIGCWLRWGRSWRLCCSRKYPAGNS